MRRCCRSIVVINCDSKFKCKCRRIRIQFLPLKFFAFKTVALTKFISRIMFPFSLRRNARSSNVCAWRWELSSVCHVHITRSSFLIQDSLICYSFVKKKRKTFCLGKWNVKQVKRKSQHNTCCWCLINHFVKSEESKTKNRWKEIVHLHLQIAPLKGELSEAENFSTENKINIVPLIENFSFFLRNVTFGDASSAVEWNERKDTWRRFLKFFDKILQWAATLRRWTEGTVKVCQARR